MSASTKTQRPRDTGPQESGGVLPPQALGGEPVRDAGKLGAGQQRAVRPLRPPHRILRSVNTAPGQTAPRLKPDDATILRFLLRMRRGSAAYNSKADVLGSSILERFSSAYSEPRDLARVNRRQPSAAKTHGDRYTNAKGSMGHSDWTALSLAAERTGLSGLVLAWGNDDCVTRAGDIPNEALERLRRSASLVAANNMNCLAQLEKALVVLRCAGIDALLLKGAALNLTLYDRPDLRPMSDVDILVRPEQGVAAQRVLVGSGWREGQELVQPDFFPRFYYATELHYNARVPVRMDLHVRPFRPLRLACTVPDGALWSDVASVRCGAECASIPSHERMFIHLAAHAAYHGLSRLIWMYDIDAYTRRYGHEIDWALVATLAGRWRLAHAVHKVSQAVTILFQTPFPPNFVDDLANQPCNWADRLCLHQAPHDAGAPVRHVLVNWVCTPDRSLAYPYLLAYLLPGRRHLETIYRRRHFGWVVVAHAWRPLRIAIRGAQWLFRRFARSSYGAVFTRRAVRVSA